jgi:hypothetical protein
MSFLILRRSIDCRPTNEVPSRFLARIPESNASRHLRIFSEFGCGQPIDS